MNRDNSTVEPQDELKEVLNEQEESQEGVSTENLEGSTTEEEVEASTEEQNKEEIDFNDPKIKEAIRIQREKDQDAVNRRIAKEVAKRKAIENQYSDFRSEFEEFKKQFSKPEQPPKFEDYDGDTDKWANDVAQYNIKKAMKPQEAPRSNNNINAKFDSLIDEFYRKDPELVRSFVEKEKEYFAKNPNYGENVEILKFYAVQNPALLEAIYDAGPEVADFITGDAEKLEQLASFGPARLGRAIAQIESNFKRSQPLPKKANPKPAPVAESRGQTTKYKDVSKMTQQEYNRYMYELGL